MQCFGDSSKENMDATVEPTQPGECLCVKPGNLCEKDACVLNLEVAVANMSFHQYRFGEGIVGKVALTGKYHWIFPEEFNNKLLQVCSEELKLQSMTSIKTILLVPIAQHGVVRLGSLHKVTEDSTLVVHIIDSFCTLYHITGTYSSLDPVMSCSISQSPLATPLMGNPSIFSALSGEFLDLTQSQQLSTIGPHVIPSFMAQDDVQSTPDVMGQVFDTYTRSHAYESVEKARPDDVWIDPTEEPTVLNCSNKIPECDNAQFLEDEINIVSQLNAIDHRSITTRSIMPNSYLKYPEYGGYDHCNIKDMTQRFRKDLAGKIAFVINDRVLNSPIESELQKALGMGSMKGCDSYILSTALSKVDKFTMFQTAGSEVHEPLVEEINAWTESGAEHLLDAVVGNLHHAASDNACKASRYSRSCSAEKPVGSCLTHSRSEGGDRSVSSKKSVSVSKGECFTGSISDSSSKITSRSVNDKNCSTMVSRHFSPTSIQTEKIRGKSNKTHRPRPRPRPRDRRLIGDRIKELQELIPNGSDVKFIYPLCSTFL